MFTYFATQTMNGLTNGTTTGQKTVRVVVASVSQTKLGEVYFGVGEKVLRRVF